MDKIRRKRYEEGNSEFDEFDEFDEFEIGAEDKMGCQSRFNKV